MLQGRLLGAINAPVTMMTDQREHQQQVTGFAEGAMWKQLKHNNEPVEEPNKNSNLVGPTVPLGEKEFKKYDFTEKFDRPPFIATSPAIQLGRNGKPIKDNRGNIKYIDEVREEG